jgi:membrane protein DedA with SNARE-associated domain
MPGFIERIKKFVLSPFKGQFLKFNLVIGISWSIGYILTVWLIDFRHYPAYIVVLALGIVMHIFRFWFLFRDNAKAIMSDVLDNGGK